MSALSLAHVVRLSPDVIVQEVSGEAVLLDLRSENYFGLDPVGLVIWRALGESGTLASAHAAVLAAFDVESVRAEADLVALVESLAEAGLVEAVAGGGADSA